MAMDDKDKRMLIRACMEQVFVPKVLGTLGVFLVEYSMQVIEARDFQQAFGINAILRPPTQLQIAPAMEALEEALLVALKEKSQ